MKPKKQRLLRQNDIIIIVGVITAALFMSAYPNPFVVAGLIALGIIIIRFIDAPKGDEDENGQPIQDEPVSPYEGMTAEEILITKMNDGTLEKAIVQRSDQMIENIANDVFSDYSDVSNTLRNELSNSMIDQLKDYDYGQYHTKLQLVLDNAMSNLTGSSEQLLNNIQTMLGTQSRETIEVSEIHQWFKSHVIKYIDTDDLVPTGDEDSPYEPITVTTAVNTVDTKSIYRHATNIELTCEEDESFNLIIGIDRWANDPNGQWTISHIVKNIDNAVNYRSLVSRFEDRGRRNILDIQTPMNNLRHLSDLELQLIKLYQDQTVINIDNNLIEDTVNNND